MSRRTEVQVRITVLVALVTLLWGVTYLKDLTLQRKVTVWKVKFPQTGGLGQSDEVQVNGIRKGSREQDRARGRRRVRGPRARLRREARPTRRSRSATSASWAKGDLRRTAPDRPRVHDARHDPRHLRARHGRGDGAGGRFDGGARPRREAAFAALGQARGARRRQATITNFRATSEGTAARAMEENRKLVHQIVGDAAAVSSTARATERRRRSSARSTPRSVRRAEPSSASPRVSIRCAAKCRPWSARWITATARSRS